MASNGNTSNGSGQHGPGNGTTPGSSYDSSSAGLSGGSFAYSSALEWMKGDDLTPAERKQLLADELGTPFDPAQRLFAAYDAGRVFDYGDRDAADYRSMLSRSGKARSLEQVLTLPLRGAPWKITADEGDSGQAKLVEDNLGDKLNLIIDQMTSALTYKRAYFETSWEMKDGKVVYSDVAHRPAGGCEAGFDPVTGRPRGFRQRIVPMGGVVSTFRQRGTAGIPGYVIINPNRSFIYTHGQHRDPINGQSEMDVALWCWQTVQKVAFLWFQFLEQQALPKTLIYGDDDTQAQARAQKLAGLRSSGILGIARPSGANERTFDILESSGKGAEQFEKAISYLESSMMESALAGFTELPAHTSKSGSGSYALSADQSEFFLASRQAVADEIADVIRRDLFAPLIAYNYGLDAPVPKIQIGPLSKETTNKAFDLLKAVVVSPTLNVPRDFVDQLTLVVSAVCGLDPDQVKESIAQDAVDRKEQADALAKQMAMAPAAAGVPSGTRPAPGAGLKAQTGPATPARPGAVAAAAPRPRPAAVAASVTDTELADAVDTGFRLVSEQLSGV